MSKLKRIRESRGVVPHEIAKKLEIGSPWYFDLEAEGADLADELSVAQLRRLARELDVSPGSLFRETETVLTPADLVDRIVAHLSKCGLSAEEFSSQVGWNIQGLLSDPRQIGSFGLIGLREICNAIGLDWLDVVDEMRCDK